MTYDQENRREQRIAMDLSVEITRYDLQGRMFTERTRIEDISKKGCRFKLRVELQAGDIVSIRPLVPGDPYLGQDEQLQLYEIRWAAQLGTRWNTGAFKLESEDLADVVFPPLNARNLPLK